MAERRMVHKGDARKIVETQEALDAAIADGWGLHRIPAGVEPGSPLAQGAGQTGEIASITVVGDPIEVPVSADIELPIDPPIVPKRGRPVKP